MSMKKKDNNSYKKCKLILLYIFLAILLFSYGFFITFSYLKVSGDNDKVLNNIYIGQFDVSNSSYDEVKNQIKYYYDSILDQKVILLFNDKEIETPYRDLGLTVDIDTIIKDIKEYQSKLSYNDKIKLINGRKRKVFKIKYAFNKDECINTLNIIKTNNDIQAVNGYFDTNEGVRFIKGTNGYALNIEESLNNISKVVDSGIKNDDKIKLVTVESIGNNNPSYEAIDSLVSTFSTQFNVWEGTRPINLRTALGYINGVVVEPGEVFSFYRYAGPFNKKGYVFYYEFVGNGVCQIATTTYNAALLGGLEIIKRYPHAKKSKYIAGGLDATVASYSSGWYVDMAWKNTYQYPIYIKAYSNGGTATVEFWSNSNAKDGKTYATESVQIGVRGYKTYLHTYKDGVEIAKNEIATTWYTES